MPCLGYLYCLTIVSAASTRSGTSEQVENYPVIGHRLTVSFQILGFGGQDKPRRFRMYPYGEASTT